MKTNSTDTKNEDAPERSGNNRRRLIAAGVILLFCMGILMLFKYRERRPPAQEAGFQPKTALISTPDVPAAIEKPAVAPESNTSTLDLKKAAVVQKEIRKVKTEIAASDTPPPTVEHKIVKDPGAREALTFVGLDEDAETYWLDAIYDTSLPKSERQDLIDDLNEEGLSDPKHPSRDDLPLLLSRLEMLEELSSSLPKELDWKESYDDLVNLVAVAQGGGKVRR